MGMCKDALEMYTKFRHTLKMFRLPSYRGCDNDWGGEQCGAEGDREQVKVNWRKSCSETLLVSLG